MAQSGEENSPYALSIFPVKRKRGRPRKDESFPSVRGMMERTQTNLPSNSSDNLVGQQVYGLLGSHFGAGYLLSVQVANTGSILHGMVFEPGMYNQVTQQNDIAPLLPMCKRNEISDQMIERTRPENPLTSRVPVTLSTTTSNNDISSLQLHQSNYPTKFPSAIPGNLKREMGTETANSSLVAESNTGSYIRPSNSSPDVLNNAAPTQLEPPRLGVPVKQYRFTSSQAIEIGQQQSVQSLKQPIVVEIRRAPHQSEVPALFSEQPIMMKNPNGSRNVPQQSEVPLQSSGQPIIADNSKRSENVLQQSEFPVQSLEQPNVVEISKCSDNIPPRSSVHVLSYKQPIAVEITRASENVPQHSEVLVQSSGQPITAEESKGSQNVLQQSKVCFQSSEQTIAMEISKGSENIPQWLEIHVKSSKQPMTVENAEGSENVPQQSEADASKDANSAGQVVASVVRQPE